MLKISSKGRYGVKVLYELALHDGQGPVALGVIARNQGMSEQYLEQLMPHLKRANLVVGVRGSQGGYRLAKPPDQVSVGDVVRALEGPIVLTDCTSDDPGICPDSGRCVGPDVWNQVQRTLVETMDAITFEQLLPGFRLRKQRAAGFDGNG